MSIRFPGESSEYRAARDRLLGQEVALRRATEAVASARRDLPPGGIVPVDYAFAAGPSRTVRLSELFDGKRSLVIYSFMFPRDPGDHRPIAEEGHAAALPRVESPCPSCTSLLDQLDGTARHAKETITFAAVAKTSIENLLAFGEDRGWRHLKLVSSARCTYNRDYHGETAAGHQRPMLNVFHRDGDVIRHFWGAELLYAPTDPDQDPRHVGTLEPLWNMFDMTREGRPKGWDEQLQYDCCHPR